MRRVLRVIATLAALAMLTGCGLPRGAAIQSEILSARDDANADVAIYPVTRALLPAVSRWPVINERNLGWISASHGPRSQVIAAGDSVDLTIWDSNENSLLTSAEQRQVQLPTMRVSSSGAIFMPYVGEVTIGGLTPAGARERIQTQLAPIAASAQVQISVSEGRGNSVDLVGGVQSPGIYPMPDRNFTVLSLISAGGGVPPTLRNPQIRLQRGAQVYGTSMNRLYAEPALDTLLRAGDQVIVEEDERYFLSIGAAGREAQHPFPQDIVTALDAVSIIGGVQDGRANPQGILILRDYPRSALAAGVQGPRDERVIFVIDLTSADGLFSARNFRIMPQDLVYPTESRVTATQTVFSLIGTAFGLATRTANLAGD
jgi:polysaccharide export outer membrane protein